MKDSLKWGGAVSLAVLMLAVVSGPALLAEAEEVPPEGNVIGRMPIEGLEGLEAIVIYYEMPGGTESGKHRMEAGREIVYIQEGSAILEVDGEEAVTVGAGETFTTVAGQVHNVKNASSEAPVKAVAFYIGQEGGTGATLSVMVE
jgi:quercetin dioxygenase-like cupin family protein